MNNIQRLEQEEEDASQRWKTIQTQLVLLREQYDAEWRVDEKLRLKQAIERKEAELNKLSQILDKFADRIAEARARALVLEARERERKQSYDSALACWKELLALSPSHYDATAEISRLTQLKAHAEQRKELLRQLMTRFKEIAPIFKGVAEFLQLPETGPTDAALLLIEQFIRNETSATDFINLWSALRSRNDNNMASLLDFVLLYHRLARGELALFLGADLLHQFDPAFPNVRRLADELAAELHIKHLPDAASWSLSAVAEYFQMKPEHGTHALVRHLHGHLTRGSSSNPLYKMLSLVDAPLLIVSANQDTQLEAEFQKANKRYVVVMSVIFAMGGFHPGQVLLQYSDRERPEEPMLGEHLSQLSLLDEGYSLIFKLRGTCPAAERPSERALCSLLLSERNHFDFARAIDKILPTYLSAKLGSRGFWFLGFAPEQWEDRLLASAILDARRNAEQANVVRINPSKFESAYWENRGVRRHEFELAHFVDQLERAFK